jgi:DNA repair protein RadC
MAGHDTAPSPDPAAAWAQGTGSAHRAPEPGTTERLGQLGLILEPAPTGGYHLTGYTFHYREAIKRAGGRWLAERRAWHLADGAALEALAALLPSGPVGATGLAEAAPGPAASGTGWGSKHYHGHRERLRQRFLEARPEGLADYELLELLLFFSVYRRDTKPLAKEMLARFGSLGGVLAADPARYGECLALQPLDSDAERGQQRDDDLRFTQVLLKSIQALMLRVLKEEIKERPVLGSWTALLDYVHTALAHESTEQFRILFLDRKNILIRDEQQSRGTVDHTPLYPREVVKRALELGASAIIMVHNHPSGDPTPSQPDIEMTKAVIKALGAVNVVVHDHVIVGKNRHLSFRSQGLI